jgi:hypothetical protein
VRLERTGQFIDEDAPDDVADAIIRWWATGLVRSVAAVAA